MRQMRRPRCILITGASSGLGAALARKYAEPGIELILHGRNDERLAAVRTDCEAAGASVATCTLDIRQTDRFVTWLRDVNARIQLDLLIVNAAVTSNVGKDGAGESWEATEEVINVNLTGALLTAHLLLPGMRERRRGQIAFISSLSAYFGLALTPAYCATKAAIKSYGEAWRGWLASEGIGVTVVLPGFIDSPMSRRFPAARPFLMSAEKAATTIKRRLAYDPARISFPFPLNLGSWTLSVLPPALSGWIVKRIGY